jgi:hypothetical protein
LIELAVLSLHAVDETNAIMSSSPPPPPLLVANKRLKFSAGDDLNSANREVPRTQEDEILKLRQEFEAEKEALRKGFEAEKNAETVSRLEFEARYQKSEAKRQEFEARYQKSEAKRQEFEAKMEAISLLFILPDSHVPIPSLELRGLPSSNSYYNKKRA